MAGNMIKNQLREVVMRSVRMLIDYFSGFKTIEELKETPDVVQIRKIEPILTSLPFIET